jgi:predicted small secreted protein
MMMKKTMRWGALALAAATLAGCATTENALKDANTLLQEREADKLLPVTNLSPYALALSRFGRMLDIYKEGDPVIYMQTRSILDATNLSSPLVGAEIPGDITEMVRTAVNRIGARVVYVPYHPDYLVSQAQLGAKFGVTMPDFLITGALTEFDRAIAGAGRVNSAGIEFGKGNGKTTLGGDVKRTAIYSALALDLNLVSFSTQQMVPQVQASNVVKVLNFSSEDNASLGFYGDAFGFKLEGKYLQGRHSAIRTLVDLSVLELIGKATNTPYWRCIPNGTPDPVVVENMRAAYNGLTPELKLGLIQVTLRKYGEPVQVTQKYDEDTQRALQKVYAERYAALGAVDVMTWQGFEPLFFGVPMAWDNTATPALAGAAPAGSAPAGAKAGT